MAEKEKKQQAKNVVINNNDNECPGKEGDNCLVPGAFNDSAPIGGG